MLVSCGGGSDPAASGAAARRSILAEITANPASGVWGPVTPLPLVPSSAANLPDGKVLLWSADDRFAFGVVGQSYTAVLDPSTGSVSEQFLNTTGQNMFCPGTTNLPDGRILVSGGSNAAKTTIYDPATNIWTVAGELKIPRAYQANTLLRDGSIFTLGGSWAGGQGGKHAEIWTAAAGWNLLPGVQVDNFLTSDPVGVYRSDNHMWLIPAGNGQVFHAGPSKAMHWIETTGNGRVMPAGNRADDGDSMSGNAVMYDTGKILKVGGGPAYENANATAASYVIDIRAGAKVRATVPMQYARAFHNSVVLPNGEVMVVGGQSYPVPFSDNTSVLRAELWNPVTETFTTLAPMTSPRNYHSVALLLPDARVISTGSGLCGQGCQANHPDYQIYTPHYLLNADGSPATRPVITAAPASALYGTTMQVTLDSPVVSFALVRMSSTTHTVNNDQRRLSLRFERGDANVYTLSVPTNPGWAIPGLYMLFALNDQGVPSVAKVVSIGAGAAGDLPTLAPISNQRALVGGAISFALQAPGATTLSVSGLPPGLAYDPALGTVSGTPTAPGSFSVTVLATNSTGAVSTDFQWSVNTPGVVRFLKFEQVSEINGAMWGAMSELNLLNSAGQVMDRSAWKISADSEEGTGENAIAALAFDGNYATFWHSQWFAAQAPLPHYMVIDMGEAQRLGGLRYAPRPGGGNGTFARYRVYVSADGVQWGNPVAEGDLRDIDPNNAAEKTVLFNVGGTAPNYAPVLRDPGDQMNYVDTQAALDLVATDDSTATLQYTATNLPPGLAIRADSGAITGVPTANGVYTVTVRVTDQDGAFATASFTWRIVDQAPPKPTVTAPVVSAGGTANFTAQVPGGTAGLEFSWDFGDGSTPTAFVSSPTASRTFASAGIYNVTVQVRGADRQVTVYTFMQAVAGPVSPAGLGRATSPIAWEPATASQPARIWVVNPDNDTVTVFNSATHAKIAEVAVGKAPRTLAIVASLRQVWVTNRDSGTVTVLNSDTRAVVRTVTLPVASQPWGVLASPQGDRIYVTLEATNRVVQLDTAGNTLATLTLAGPPRHMAITADGTRLWMPRFVTPPQPGESTLTVRPDTNGVLAGGQVWSVGTSPLALRSTTVLRHSAKADSTVQGRGVPNYLGAPAISPDGVSAWIPSKQDNIYRGKLRDGLDLDFQNTVRAIGSRIVLASAAEDYARRLDYDNSSLASASLFHPTGAYLFTALETSRHIAVVDPVSGRELFRVDSGRAPQGLAVSGDGLTLLVMNFMDRSVSAYNLAPLVQRGQISLPLIDTFSSVGTEKLAPQVLLGKQLFYDARDPRLARDSYMSCASCHSDGGTDGRTWDLRSLGEGLRNTASLRGRAGAQGRLHWSGNMDEIQDFEIQIRALAGGTGLLPDALLNVGTRAQPLGDPKAGLSADLDALAAYLQSLDSFAPSPMRMTDGTLTTQAQAGRSVFAAQCVSCHGGASFTNSAAGTLQDVGTLRTSSGLRSGGPLTGIDIPTLRDVWATAPYLHNGSATSIEAAINAHTTLPALSSTDLASVAAFVRQIGGTEPGQTVARGRYVRLEAISEVNNQPWTSMAEFDLLDMAGAIASRVGWTVRAVDSQETTGENGAASNVLDGDPATIWHTGWSSGDVPIPHWIVIDTGAVRDITGFRMRPRDSHGNVNGTINSYRFYVSSDGVNWGAPVAQGRLLDLGPATATKTVNFGAQ
ncbi:discoidin domain-containing protein [Xylophilus sp. GOD-11R]|uniref:discoidin domain-containing protein n=1 Tax=Xylophilus sp. GOD-11R TaxID=3089814 RepID=UPI00298CBC9B|nr:discoidin domain-containing protein [Xylophilus sp. GOD-11R]WPB55468.1 discoidin domain-containing protein [Xylophilus sp. GOD-11R]